MPVSDIYPRTNVLQIHKANSTPRVLWCLKSATQTDLRGFGENNQLLSHIKLSTMSVLYGKWWSFEHNPPPGKKLLPLNKGEFLPFTSAGVKWQRMTVWNTNPHFTALLAFLVAFSYREVTHLIYKTAKWGTRIGVVHNYVICDCF